MPLALQRHALPAAHHAMPPQSQGHATRRRFISAALGVAAGAALAGCARRHMSDDEQARADAAQRELAALEARGIRANPYRAGRTMTMSRRGIVATSHVLASQAGLDMRRSGGTAMDAAIAATAVLSVVEPMSTGLGGDAFFIYYDAATGKLHGLNGSGRSPRSLTRDELASRGGKINVDSWDAVTIPGAVDAFAAGLGRFGRKSLAEVLAPAIALAADGFAVTQTVGAVWRDQAAALRRDPWTARTFLIDGRAPRDAEVFRNPNLARSLQQIADGGRDAFYRGPIAEEIVRYGRESGAALSMSDFAEHESTWVEPITTNYRGYDCHQIPPNGQGIGVLMMLNMLEGFDIASMPHNSPQYLHLLIEAKKLAYADMYTFIADPSMADVPVEAMLDKTYAARRRKLINPRKAADVVAPGIPQGSDTVYLTAIDQQGNACSFIHSIYHLFGSKITGGSTGILLQNRGGGFTLEPGHRNVYAPGKRPYHTIIPGMVTHHEPRASASGRKLYLSYGLMGGPMQPQGHVQYLLSHLDHGMTIQEANDVPRWQHTTGRTVLMEHGMPRDTMAALERMGHQIIPAPGGEFGGAQAIAVHPESGVYLGSSDPRKDGAALGY